MNTATPPRWAESLLRAVLAPSEFETLAGDLLEEYRESRYPMLGELRADAWYVRQVFGFVVRAAWPWGAAFGAAIVIRDALDWLAPPQDFHFRATVSTMLAIFLLLAASVRAAWRCGRSGAGVVAGAATAVIGALIGISGAAALLAIWHDPATLAAIRGSGGVEEAFTLPLFTILPGLVLGAVGGCAAALRHV
jgi:hypothetical protein